MLAPTAEADELQAHFASRLKETCPDARARAAGPWSATEAPYLDPDLLYAQLLLVLVPRRKAVPQNHPPSAVWRCCADIVAAWPWLCTQLQELWQDSRVVVPQSWADVDLALVPKPGNVGHKLEDHRPIGLSCPLGKQVLSCLLVPVVPTLLSTIRRNPQFAYQQGRSQYDALRRAFRHCHSVRQELDLHSQNIHARKAGRKPVLWDPTDRGQCWETDDNRVMCARASPPKAMLRNGYLIALIRSL